MYELLRVVLYPTQYLDAVPDRFETFLSDEDRARPEPRAQTMLDL